MDRVTTIIGSFPVCGKFDESASWESTQLGETMERTRVFVSYCRDDLRHLEDFQEILSPYLRALPEIWSDGRIDPGDQWQKEISDALGSAKIAVLLVTPSFLASSFIKRVEFPDILHAHENDGLIVFWIPVSSSGYKYTSVRHFQAAWEPEQPLDLMKIPKRRKVWVEIAERLMAAAGVIEQTDLPSRPRVVILHRTGAQPDECILKLLENGLPAAGYEVFTVKENSLEVLNQLNNHLTRADSVLPLISAQSDSSEMLAMHIQMAREKSEKQNGRPQLVPILIQYLGAAGGILHACNSLRQVVWRGQLDDSTLVARVTTVLRGGQDPLKRGDAGGEGGGNTPSRESPPSVPQLQVISGAGAVAHTDPHYILRDTDEQLRRALLRGDSIVRIQGARQMGKTSLLLRGLRMARDIGARIVSMDFQAFNRSQFESYDSFYRSLAETLVEDLGLDDIDVAGLWKSRVSANWNLERVLKRHILPGIDRRLVWSMDEVERLFQFNLSDDFFGLIRSWHNCRSNPKGLILERLTVVISHATESHLFAPAIIRNPNASPFNVATSLMLVDFTLDQVKALNERFSSPLATDEIIELYALVGGQPFLVRRALETLKSGEPFRHFLLHASGESGPFADHLRRILQVLASNPALLQAVQAFVTQGKPLSTEEFYRLRTAGVFAGDSAASARPRCRLYAEYLSRNLAQHEFQRGA